MYRYLDNFIIIAPPPHSPQCANSYVILDRECSTLSVSIASHKYEGPTTCLPVLGVIISTVAGEFCLPADKLERLQSLLQQMGLLAHIKS